MIDIYTPCRTCGYDLRGLDESGRCPECGRVIAESLADDLLRFADPEWLGTVAGGCGAIFWGSVIWVVAMVFLVVRSPVAYCLLAASGGLQAVGVWGLTLPDPSGLGEAEYGRARRAARQLLLTAAAGGTLVPAFATGPLVLSTTALALSACALAAGAVALLRYLMGLMRRVPDAAVGRAWLLKGAVVAVGSCALATALVATLSPARRGAASGLLPLLFVAGVVTVPTVGVFALELLAHVGRVLRREARRAADHRTLVAARIKSARSAGSQRAGG